MTSASRRRRGRGIALLVVIVGGGVAWGLFGRSSDDPTKLVDANGERAGGEHDGAEAVDTGRSLATDPRRDLVGDTPAVARERETPILTLGAGSSTDRTGSPTTATPATPSNPVGKPSTQEPIPGAGQLDGQPIRFDDSDGTSAADSRRAAERPSRPSADSGASSSTLQVALALVQRDPVEARRLLTAIATDYTAPAAERARAREGIATVNATILFSPLVLPNDPFVTTYTVQSGDTLQRIRQHHKLDADWRFLMRVNAISDERRVRLGQALKLVNGPFHAIVSKSEHRMEIFLGESADRVMVASFPVGLGEYNSTPTGRFKVRVNSKLVNPSWVNPRTGERFAADDPKNPIGERWIGLEGIDTANREVDGYGIHGTIDPASIGRQASMGCVRMLHDDVALVYELLTEPNSTVTIVD